MLPHAWRVAWIGGTGRVAALTIAGWLALGSLSASSQPAAAQSRSARLVGFVVADDTGRPVDGAVIRFADIDNTTETDEDGRFEIDDVEPGRHIVLASATGYELRAYGQQRRQEAPSAVEFPPGATSTIEVRLLRLGRITGRLLNDAGAPAAGISVSAVRQHPDRGLSSSGAVTTNAAGEFELAALERGHYVVVATTREPPAVRSTSFFPGTTAPDQAVAISIDAGVSADASFVFTTNRDRPARLAGKVFDSRGQPARGALVSAQSALSFGTTSGSLTDEEGRFEIVGVVPGEYRLEVLASLPDYTMQAVARDPEILTRLASLIPVREFGAIQLKTDGRDVDGLEIHTGKGFTIHGRLIDRIGRPLELQGITITARRPGAMKTLLDKQQQASTRADGSFVIDGLLGSYLLQTQLPQQLMVREPDRRELFAVDRIVSARGESADDGINITQDLDVDVILGSPTDIEGMVRTRRGDVVKAGRVFVFVDDASRWSLPPTPRWIVSQEITSEGEFQIFGLPPGSYYAAVVFDYFDAGAPDVDELEELTNRATRLKLNEGETKAVTITID